MHSALYYNDFLVENPSELRRVGRQDRSESESSAPSIVVL